MGSHARRSWRSLLFKNSSLRTLASSAPSAYVLVLLLAGCADKIPVKVERDPLTSFSRFTSYTWLVPEKHEDVFDLAVHNAVDLQLAGKGYALAYDPQQADLAVGATTVVEEKHAETIGDYVRYQEAGGTQPLGNAYAIGYEQAKITVEVFARDTGQPVWRGVGLIAMDAKGRAERAVAAVAEMFKQFPRR